MNTPVRLARIAVLATLASSVVGCAIVPRSKLDDCHLRAQALQAETARLKDEALSLRNQNRDLNQRAVDDAHLVRDLEQTNDRLERSVMAYQAERETLNEAFEQLKRQVQLAADPPTTAMVERFDSFARAHPGTTFDSSRGVWTVPPSQLFQPGSAAFQRDAPMLLTAFARLVAERQAPSSLIKVVGRSDASAIHAVALTPPPASAGSLSLDRANRLREFFAGRLNVDPSSIGVAGDDAEAPGQDGAVRVGNQDDAGIEIHLRSASPSTPPVPKPPAAD
jgi:chemotaxis protein MotB